jgi:poly(hydroxyalkanoate) granule-associated protein
MAAKKGKRRSVRRATAKVDVVEFGQKVWLAGLGAFARARSEGPMLFESLAEEGAAVQAQARDSTETAVKDLLAQVRSAADERIATVRGKANETWGNVEKIFQSRVHKALQQLGMPTSQEIRALTKKVDELSRGVDALSKRERRASRAARGAQRSHSNIDAGAAI